MHLTRLAAALLVCAVSAVASAAHAEIYPHRGFLTGSAFLALSPPERLYYTTGVLEGVLSAPYLGSPLERPARLDRCLSDMSNAHVADVLTAYLGKHAEERPFEMPSVTLRALAILCGTK
jgi:hypothetical protein